MKKQILFLILCVLLLTLFSCNDGEFTTEKDYNINDQLVVPKGSTLKIDKTANSVDFKLPKGYVLIGETTDGQLSRLYEGGTLTCTCTSPSNGGCSPFVAQGPNGEITGCAMSNCTSCTGTVKGNVLSEGGGEGDGETEILYLNKINVVKADDAINFVVDIKEFESLKNPTSEIMNSEFATKTISEFLKGFQSQNKEQLARTTDINRLKEIGYILVPVNFYGYRIYLPVDKSLKLNVANPMVNDVIAKYLDDGGGSYSCKCNTNEGGCVLKTKSIPLLGSATWCEAGKCGSCTMTSN
ncbi:MAG: hypothetical protein QM564_12520 [Bergeyella sp.]